MMDIIAVYLIDIVFPILTFVPDFGMKCRSVIWFVYLYTCLYSGTSVHEQIFRAENVSVDERFLGLRTRKLATAVGWEYRRGECQLLVNFGSVHIPAWFRFTNGLQERIKFVNRGPIVFTSRGPAVGKHW
jgi:hypothetical protein